MTCPPDCTDCKFIGIIRLENELLVEKKLQPILDDISRATEKLAAVSETLRAGSERFRDYEARIRILEEWKNQSKGGQKYLFTTWLIAFGVLNLLATIALRVWL